MFDNMHQQNLADRLKGLVSQEKPSTYRQRALKAIQRFEGLAWHPGAFAQAVAEDAPGRFDIDTGQRLTYAGDALAQDVIDVLTRYGQLIETRQVFSTVQAAEYLGITESGMKKLVFRPDSPIPGEMIGNSKAFTRAELDRYHKTRRGVGRPRVIHPNE